MSLDYYYYKELRRRKHRAAWSWLVGDRLYYLGLLTGMLALPTAGMLLIAWGLGLGTHYLELAGFAAVTIPVAVVVFVVGASLKKRAYSLAERDGISSTEAYLRGTSAQAPDAEPVAREDGGAV